MRVLNVGGGSRIIPVKYEGWEQVLLDIDPTVEPDICCDARELFGKEEQKDRFDTVYCSHCLEHFYYHDVATVLKGFLYALNDDGYVDITVPNINGMFADMKSRNLDIHDIWYRTGENLPITFHDVLYGWNTAMKDGNLYYAHRCGFTPTSMSNALTIAGFGSVWVSDQNANIHAIAHKKEGVPCP